MTKGDVSIRSKEEEKGPSPLAIHHLLLVITIDACEPLSVPHRSSLVCFSPCFRCPPLPFHHRHRPLVEQLNLGKRNEMAKKSEERLDFIEQEILEIRTEMKKLPAMEENMSLISKSIENTNVQMEKQQLQQQVAIISFDGLALDWDGTLVGRFLTIKQETTVEEYRNRFDKYLALVAFLQTVVLEETFMNELNPWLKTEVEVLEPRGLAQMMKLALKIEDRERVRKECGLVSVYGSKFQYNLPKAKENTENKTATDTTGGTTPMRTITLRGVTTTDNWREGFSKRLSDAEFQARRKKGEFEIVEEEGEGEAAAENTIEVGIVENLNIELSINSVVGLTNPGTMKVKGKVKNEDVVVFINWAAIKGKGICGKVEVLLGDWKFVDSFLPLELEGVDVILGMHWLHSLGVTEVDWKHLIMTFQHEGRKVIIRGDPSLTKKGTLAPKRGIEHHIHLKQGTNPVNVRPYRYAHQQKEEMERLVYEILASGIIRPGIVGKEEDGSWRICVDYRALNNVIMPDKFPILVSEELFDELNGANMCSKIDLKTGYHQIRMNQKDVEKIAFCTHEGRYEFLVMSFGLTNASSTFQSLMNAVFKPYMRRFVLVFFDDILVCSKGLEEHMQHLELVLEILRANELYANLAKCSFAQERVGYLGHIISEKGVENYGSTTGPLTQLLKNGAFKWNEEANESFEKLKTATMTLPVLDMPDFNLSFEIVTDASGFGGRVVLTQAKRPIAYFSRTLSTRDRARHRG
ncbi:ty3-gypsy retroelement transposase [Cucumis melo var. makuwa]|uniref:Ty3-gypsy retroelement transposase n=1 Tax=Cucumis melo var. makuwa TaxID=1194695 RepID=A0A5A7T409_CUCMM|nr:ty3-gypsy retroelement transposase [Cucumis melo var. makuwa]